MIKLRQKEGEMENEKENAELNIGATFPSWLAIFLAALSWACIALASWDFLAEGMDQRTFLVIAFPLVFIGVWFTLLIKESIRAERWLAESKRELVNVRADNDRTETRRLVR